jgi:hypothetical protein
MGKKIGRISTIKREYPTTGMQTMEGALIQKKLTRVPGTGVFRYPYKERDGKYRTGLDPGAAYIQRIQDTTQKKLEIDRVNETLKRVKEALGDIDLGPRAPFWNYALSLSTDDPLHVKPVKLMDGDNYFDLSSPMHELAFSWLRVHPMIASSYQAWQRGEYPADTQFYVADEEIENEIVYNKKQEINKAIIKFDSMTPDRKKKVARLLGLPVTDDTKEHIVYNLVDSLLKDSEFKSGEFKGFSTIEMFSRFADLKENLLNVKDLVKQAIAHSIYRMKPNGSIYEGEYEVAKDEDGLIKFLLDDDNQETLLTLEGKLKTKKMAEL